MLTLTLSLLLAAAPPVPLRTPQEALQWAAKDVRTLAPETAKYCRYLTLFNVPAAQRRRSHQVLQSHLNGLSREPDLVPLYVVPGTGETLIRVDIRDYGWKAAVWEQLSDVEPYYHVKVETVEDVAYGYRGDDGRWVVTEHRREPSGRRKSVPSDYGDPASVGELVARTHSQVPLVRADWLFNQTAIQQDRRPGYYDFLGLKTRDDFEKLIGFDAKVVKGANRKELLDAVAKSAITRQPRRLGAFDSVGRKRYWRSFDSFRATDKNNPLRVLNDDFKHDAEEAFGELPNGMWAWLLSNDKGVLQDVAPDRIANHDRTAPGNDTSIHVNLSCIRCHYAPALGGVAGLQGLRGKEWAKNLLTFPGRLQSPDYDVLRDLRQKYLRNLLQAIEDDRLLAGRVVLEATTTQTAVGLAPDVWAKEVGNFWARYEEADVDVAWAANDLGVTPEAFVEALRKVDEAGRAVGAGLDPVLGNFVQKHPQPLGIRQWEEVYPLALLAVQGKLVPPLVTTRKK